MLNALGAPVHEAASGQTQPAPKRARQRSASARSAERWGGTSASVGRTAYALCAVGVVQLSDQAGHARGSKRPRMSCLVGRRKDVETALACSGLAGEGCEARILRAARARHDMVRLVNPGGGARRSVRRGGGPSDRSDFKAVRQSAHAAVDAPDCVGEAGNGAR